MGDSFGRAHAGGVEAVRGDHHAGLLLRGETAHYEAIYTEVARGIGQSQQETGVPHAFGVLTCETLEQALDRAGVKAGNKGFEAAIAAIEMASIGEAEGSCRVTDGSGALMGTRRKSRELTMQMLFQGDLGKQKPEEVERLFWASRDDVDDETTRLCRGPLPRRHARARTRSTSSSRSTRRTGGWSGCRWWTATCCARRWRRCWGFRTLRRRSSSTRRWRLRKRYAAPESLQFLNGVLDAIGRELLDERLNRTGAVTPSPVTFCAKSSELETLGPDLSVLQG